MANEGLGSKVGIPDPKNVSCHPGGDDCILGRKAIPKRNYTLPTFNPHDSCASASFLERQKDEGF